MRKSLQELGIHEQFFYYPRGKFNAITDVEGVKVGHSTVIKDEDIRTGVSVIIPPGLTDGRLIAGGFAFNANGDVTGFQYIFEEGRLISPIFLTNTFSVGDVFSSVVDYYKGEVALPIIGECWDGYLSDIEGRHVKYENVVEAIETASSGEVKQGNVGAGTGMTSFGFKSGIGTSSRKLTIAGKEFTIGVLVNNNIGNDHGSHRYLRIGGVETAKLIGEYDPKQDEEQVGQNHQHSSICVIATDIPLTHYQLNRIAKHTVLGMGRMGIVSGSGSGDFIISFSTANKVPKRGTVETWTVEAIEETRLDLVFEATIEAVEESYLNSLLLAEDMQGKEGHFMRALPVGEILEKIKK